MPSITVLRRSSEYSFRNRRAGGSVRIRTVPSVVAPALPPEWRSEASALFVVDDQIDESQIKTRRIQEADRLLRRTNHLIRWYRAVTQLAQMTEVTRWQVSPYRFRDSDTNQEWSAPLEFEPPESVLQWYRVPGIPQALREGLTSGQEPAVSSLTLLDAQYALNTGRFRESVPFCWSAIDSTFGRRYEILVDRALDGEWSEARKFFRGHADVPLRHRMSAMMHLISGRSLYREPGLWAELSASYDHRNNIIHRGDNATEAQGELALKVARKVLAIMESL